MVIDLNLQVEIVGMPIVREPDGLAMSSRNAYLSPNERKSARCLTSALLAARELFQRGENDPFILRELVMAVIGAEPTAAVEYAELRDGDTLEEIRTADSRTLLALAVRIGRIRLIDNCILGEDK
jgi:pantoate--beta-alanine ligase